MTADHTRTYGVLIEAANRYGTEYVTVTVMAREGDTRYPINPETHGESTWGDAPRKQAGLMLADLVLDGHWYQSIDAPSFLGFAPRYSSPFAVGLKDAERMVKTLRRIHKATSAADASEPGDILMALAGAMGLTWWVSRAEPRAGAGFYTESTWHWRSINEGRTHLRRLIAETRPEAPAIAAA